MTRPKPLFIMGNKRSGSTLMTDLLISHANVFVSHESDIAWILYQSRNGRPARYETHPLDSRLMLDSTLKSCRRLRRSGQTDHLSQRPQPQIRLVPAAGRAAGAADHGAVQLLSRDGTAEKEKEND